MNERVEWLGTTWLAAGITAAIVLGVLVLAVVVTVGMVGDLKTLWPLSWWRRRRAARRPSCVEWDVQEETGCRTE